MTTGLRKKHVRVVVMYIVMCFGGLDHRTLYSVVVSVSAMPWEKCTAISCSGWSLQQYLALLGKTPKLELNSLNLVSTGTKDEKAVRL